MLRFSRDLVFEMRIPRNCSSGIWGMEKIMEIIRHDMNRNEQGRAQYLCMSMKDGTVHSLFIEVYDEEDNLCDVLDIVSEGAVESDIAWSLKLILVE